MKTLMAVVLAVLALTGCAGTQEQYHASIRDNCIESGFGPDTPAFKECFAKKLHRKHYTGLSNFPQGKDHGWKHDLE